MICGDYGGIWGFWGGPVGLYSVLWALGGGHIGAMGGSYGDYGGPWGVLWGLRCCKGVLWGPMGGSEGSQGSMGLPRKGGVLRGGFQSPPQDPLPPHSCAVLTEFARMQLQPKGIHGIGGGSIPHLLRGGA